MRSRYQLAFYYPTGKLATVCDLTSTESLRYSRKLNGVGGFLLTTPNYHPVMEQKDALVRVFRTHPLTGNLAEDAVYYLRGIDDVYTSYTGTIVTGYSLEYLLKGRLFVPEDDPLCAGGYSTKGCPAATLMKQIVDEQCIQPATNTARAIPGLSSMDISVDTSPYATFREEIKQQYVIDLLDKLSKAYGIDYWIDFAGINTAGGYFNLSFNVGRRGENRSKAAHPSGPYIYLSADLGNLSEPQLTRDASDEGNVVFVLGKGANGHRMVYQEVGAGVADSPVARREFAVEASQVDSLDDLLTPATTGLAEHKAKTTFTFKPQPHEPGARYRQDLDLGNTVTVAHRGYEFSMRVVNVEITATGNGEQIENEMELVA